MSVKFFGQYLVEVGAITNGILAKAVGMQDAVNRSFGQTAQLMGLLSPEEVTQINMMQRTEDLLFGDAAIKLGLLDDTQVQLILAQQKQAHLFLGDALVRMGSLDENRLHHYLAEFTKVQASYRTTGLELPEGTPCPALCRIVGDTSHKMLSRVAKITFKPDICELVKKIDGNNIAISIDFSGDISARYYITFPFHIRRQIAIAMISNEQTDLDDSRPSTCINDTLMHFVHIICDNIVFKASGIGIRLVPINTEVIDNDDDIFVSSSNIAVLFPVHLYNCEWIDIAFVVPE